MNEFVVKGVKYVVNCCVNRTVAKGLNNLTATYNETPIEKVVRFIGVNGLSIVVTVATKKVVNELIDDLADKIADIYVKFEKK